LGLAQEGNHGVDQLDRAPKVGLESRAGLLPEGCGVAVLEGNALREGGGERKWVMMCT
jgi:hypothetical protein